MIQDVNSITTEKNYSLLFSLCCIVTDFGEYDLMKQSFISHGFNQNIEFLVADNSTENKFDAYLAINRFLQDANGKFVMIVHQDVRCEDDVAILHDIFKNLQQQDTAWAVCGNAGGAGYKNTYYNLNDNGRIRQSNHLPKKVNSLDENFLVIKNSSNLCVSSDIKNFHFYGTDLCIIAEFLGFHCYVIPFMVKHLSSGNLNDMYQKQPAFVKAYGRKLSSRFIQTSCTKFYLSNSVFKNQLYNSPLIFFWVKAYNRFCNLFKGS